MNTSVPSSAPADCSAPREIQVLIADDHAMVRDGLRRIVEGEADLCVCGQAVDGASTLARLQDTPCDVLLLDLSMPAPNGPELITHIRETWPDLPILVLSMHNSVAVARAALQAGASGYIAKDNDPEVLVLALRQVVGAGRYVEPRLAEALLFSPPSRPLPTLTPREAEVMHRLVNGESNADIARDLYLSEKTVSTHKTNLMAKLKLKSVAEMVRFVDEARRVGGLNGNGNGGAAP